MGERKTKEISNFVKAVNAQFAPQKIILFGSRAVGNELKTSDYDIIVVSKNFHGINFIKRLEMLQEMWSHKFRLDVLAYTPKEFNIKRKQIGIVQEATRHGVKLL